MSGELAYTDTCIQRHARFLPEEVDVRKVARGQVVLLEDGAKHRGQVPQQALLFMLLKCRLLVGSLVNWWGR